MTGKQEAAIPPLHSTAAEFSPTLRLMPVSQRFHRAAAIFACFAILLALGCERTGPSAGPSVSDASSRSVQSAVQHPAAGEPAPDFNYYLLALSWSPEYCHGHPNSAQCDGSHPGFVVHGLWPQRNDGQWPSGCSSAPGLADPGSMLDIMPSRRLIAHEWEKHGTCTGLSPQQYFATVRRAYGSIHIPPALVNPRRPRRVSAAAIKAMFTAANPGLNPSDMAIACHNRYFSGTEICLNTALQPTDCRSVRDCTANSITIPHFQPR